MPSSINIKVSIGTAPSWKTGSISREYVITQTGGTSPAGFVYFHYRDNELNAAIEENLTPWISPTPTQIMRSNYDLTDNWIAISNYTLPSSGTYTLANYDETTAMIWVGDESTDWNEGKNWSTNNSVPTSTSNVIIRDVGAETYFTPILSA